MLAAPIRTRRFAWALMTAPLALALLAPTPALAHERRPVGPYTLSVGFITEPALLGEPNGVDLRIVRTDTNEPVENAHQTLKVAIAAGGGQPKEFPLRSRFGMPGAYIADVIPTKAGSYIFTFTGTIDGTSVNQRFESGPGRFNDVEAADKLQFPDVVPAAASLSASVKNADERATAAEERAAAAEAKVGQAQVLGIGGLVLGLLGTALGAISLMAARRAAGQGRDLPRPAAARA